MKTIPKRSDLYTNPTQSNCNMEKQLSQLLQIKNIFNSKLTFLSKTIEKDVISFVNKNYPNEVGDLNLHNLENNLFGTNRTFLQFSLDFKQLSKSLQSDIKGVIQVLQKFSFTKSLSVFITDGIVDNFTKINDFMLKRQEYSHNLMKKIQQNMLNGNSIYAKSFTENNLCQKCHSSILKQKIISTRDAIIVGGQKICNFYKKNLEGSLSSGSEEQQVENNLMGEFYTRIEKIKKKVKRSMNKDNQFMTQEDMRYNLDRLQNNLEQRKYDILACLVEMGQFGSELSKQSQNLQKVIDKKNQVQPLMSSQLQKLNQLSKIPPKFNYKQFTFNVGKHFYKQIKDIQSQLFSMKNKYSTLISSQVEGNEHKQTQCNLIKDSYDIEMQKHTKRTSRQINNMSMRIKQLEQSNNMLQNKVKQYEYAFKMHISSKFEQDNQEVQKISMYKRISKLIDKYEKKIKQQQKQLKDLTTNKITKSSNQLKNSQQKIATSQNHLQKQNNIILCQQKLVNNDKQNINETNQYYDNNKNDINENKKKISLFLQPLIKKLHQKDYHSKRSSNYLNNTQIISSANQLSTNNQITQLTIQNNIDSSQQHINTSQPNKNSEKQNILNHNLSINSKIVQISLNSKPFYHKASLKRQSAVLQPRSIQILTKQTFNNSSSINLKQPYSQLRYQRKQKLYKVKSQQDSKIQRNDSSHEDKSFFKTNKKNQISAQNLKRYISEHSTYLQEQKGSSSLKRNEKQKASKKVLKTLSLTTTKEPQQDVNQPKSTLKLPSLSQHQNQVNKVQKLKQLQKIPLENKNSTTLLTKKKRKKRHFSQQNLTMESLLDNNQMTMSLGCKFENEIKQKKKKQYIIDFIPKVQQEVISRCKEEYLGQVQNEVISLFEVFDKKKTIIKRQKSQRNTKKCKYYTKTIHIKQNTKQGKHVFKLNNQEISISTKLYTAMASIKSANMSLYLIIRQKLKKQYEKIFKIKTNCDQTSSIARQICEGNNKSHLPLTLSIQETQNQLNVIQSSFEMKKIIHQTMSTNSNQTGENEPVIKNQKLKQKQNDETELRGIINYLIVKHRKLCQIDQIVEKKEQNNSSSFKSKQKQFNSCQHISKFYKYLLQCAVKINNQH